MFIVWKYHLLINKIIIMTHSVMSVTTGEYLLVKSTPGIWVYTHATIHALNWPYIFFLKTLFESIRCYLEVYLFFWIFSIPPCLLCYFRMDIRHPSLSTGSLWCHASCKLCGLPYYDNSTLKYVCSWCISAFSSDVSSSVISLNLSLMYLR